jgi:hypothetical protein
VQGTSQTGIGVKGTGVRGAQFSGTAAQLTLVPAGGNHPTSGQDGDLFLDSSKQLWLCTAGGNPATWQQLGAAGGGGGTNPVVAHSHAAATPAVYGGNDSNDPNSAGLSGKALNAGQQPGAGIGVVGESGIGIGVKGLASGGTSAGIGVLGAAQAGTGVKGTGSYGLWGEPAGIGAGVFGISTGAPYAVFGASYTDSTHNTRGSGIGVRGESGSGTGISALSEIGSAISATSGGNGPAIDANNTADGGGIKGTGGPGVAVQGQSTSGYGVEGISVSGTGIHALGATGVQASGNDVGVCSTGSNRGGIFAGAAAQLQLVPNRSQVGHPTAGQQGDLYLGVDANSNLTPYLCTLAGSPAVWKRVQLV